MEHAAGRRTYTGVEFPYDAQERDDPVVVTVASFALVLVEGDDLGILHDLRHSSLSPTLAKDIAKRLQESMFLLEMNA